MEVHLTSAAAIVGDKRGRDSAGHSKSKAERDIVLLRLNKGDMARLDAASEAAGLSRAAFAREYAMPLVDAFAHRAAAIDKAATENGETFEAFVGRAFDLALAPTNAHVPHGALAAAMEFDALFGAG